MSVAKVVEIVSNSEKNFEDAVQQGLREAAKSLQGISGLEVTNWTCEVENEQISRYKVTMRLAFQVESSS